MPCIPVVCSLGCICFEVSTFFALLRVYPIWQVTSPICQVNSNSNPLRFPFLWISSYRFLLIWYFFPLDRFRYCSCCHFDLYLSIPLDTFPYFTLFRYSKLRKILCCRSVASVRFAFLPFGSKSVLWFLSFSTGFSTFAVVWFQYFLLPCICLSGKKFIFERRVAGSLP